MNFALLIFELDAYSRASRQPVSPWGRRQVCVLGGFLQQRVVGMSSDVTGSGP
jgi:hypothetical protein